jgi:hypothetical protein
MAWQMFTWLEACDWQHLPCEGGLLDQPEALMDDLATISHRKSQLKEMLKGTPTGFGGYMRK